MRNKLQLIIRLFYVAVFLWIAPCGMQAEEESVWNGTDIANQFAGGNGEELNPYQIATATELAYLAQQVNLGNNEGGSDYAGKYFKLMNDIDLNNQEWTPIGNTIYKIFKGSFDGNKHTIKNLKIDNVEFAGLFGNAGGGTIQNLGVIISEQGIKGTRTAGGIVGESYTSSDDLSIKNCFVTGSSIKVEGSAFYAGGIIGTVNSSGNISIEYCYVAVNEISSIITSGGNSIGAGGIAGNATTVEHCLSFTNLIKAAIAPNAAGDMAVQRMVTLSHNPTIKDCYSSSLTLLVNGTNITNPTGNDPTDKNGADITRDNFHGNLGGILAGWENAGWTLHDGQLPTLDPATEGLPLDQFVVIGNGSKATPYKINSTTIFNYYAYQINQNVAGFNNTKHFKLANDITLPSGWTPMGTTDHPFKGTFDGDNHTVSLSLKADAKQAQAGLFGTIDGGATVRKVAVNVVADGITSTASGAESKAGAIAAVNEGTIDQCYVSGEGFVLSSDGTNRHAGGIAGDNSGTISNCYNLIPVKVNDSSDSYLGGIAGHNTGTIEYCFATEEVSIAADAVVSSLTNGMDETAGGIVGFNDHENAGIVRHCLAVNAKIPADAHRVIGTGADTDDDVNNFSFHDMPRQITKSADVYDPLEGTPLTSSNLNSDAGGCFNGWNTSVWDLNSFNTLPKLQGFTSQPEKLMAPYLLHTVKIDLGSNGTLSVTRPDPLNGSEIAVNNDDQVPYNTVLTITANPDADYELDALTVNGTTFSNGTFHTVTDNVTVKVTFKKKEVKPDPEPSPEPEPTVYYTVTLPAVEGAVTDPVAGAYEVESWGSFRFYLSLDKKYDQSAPIVTTSRGETITPRTSDGAYIIKYVRQPLDIFIDGIVKNPAPVANEKIEANHPKIWKTGNELHIQAVTDEPGYIYTPDGKLQTVCHLIAGEVETVRLPDGIYFVRIGKERFKIVL